MNASYIQIEKGKIRTIILACDYDKAPTGVKSYKDNGWKVIKKDWTKERTILPDLNIAGEMKVERLGESAAR